MKELMNELDSAFKSLSAIDVHGDAVDHMAIARAKLRSVYLKLKEMDEQQSNDDTQE